MISPYLSGPRTVSSESQFSSLPQVEPSPVGYPPIMSLNNVTGLSDGSVFHPGSGFYPGSVSQPHHQRQDSLTRKLSLDPHERVKVNKLNSVSIKHVCLVFN